MRHLARAMLALLAVVGVDAGAARADYFVTSFADGNVDRYSDAGTYLGTPIQGLTFPQGITIGPNGNIYVTNNPDPDIITPADAPEIREYDQAGNLIGSFSSPFSGVFFTDVAIGPAFPFTPGGSLLVSSFDAFPAFTEDAILIYDLATRTFSGFGYSDPALQGPDGILYDPAIDPNTIYVSSSLSNEVQIFDVSTGVFLGAYVAAGDGGLDAPSDITFGPDGDLYVSSSGSDEVLRYAGPNSGIATPGTFLGVAAAGGGLTNPIGHIFTPGGELLVTSNITGDPDRILRFDASVIPGQFLGDFASGPPLQGAGYIAYTPNVIPEPSSLVMGGLGVLGLAAVAVRRRSARRG